MNNDYIHEYKDSATIHLVDYFVDISKITNRVLIYSTSNNKIYVALTKEEILSILSSPSENHKFYREIKIGNTIFDYTNEWVMFIQGVRIVCLNIEKFNEIVRYLLNNN